MNFKTTIILAFICFAMGTAIAQKDTKPDDTRWDKRVQTGPSFDKNWSIGLGVNVVDDSGEGLYIGDEWNVSIPLALSVEYYMNTKFSINALFSINKYKEGKKIDGNFVTEGYEASYFAGDLALKFYLREWFRTPVLDPYIFVGGGYTSIGDYRATPGNRGFNPDTDDLDENGNLIVPQIGRFTFNTGFGMNIWISNNWGITGAATGKWGFKSGDYERGSNSVSNQIQYTMGILYLFKG